MGLVSAGTGSELWLWLR